MNHVASYLRESDVLFLEHLDQQVLDGGEAEGGVWLHEQLHKELLFLTLWPPEMTFTALSSTYLVFML